jgi:hypothetical protein
MTTAPRRPEGRYDEPRRLPRLLVVLLTGLLGLAVLIGAYAAYRHVAGHTTSASVLGFDVPDDGHVVVRLEVRHDREKDARCELVAYDRDHVTVGHQTLQLGRDLAGRARISATLTTSGRTYAVRVTGCSP